MHYIRSEKLSFTTKVITSCSLILSLSCVDINLTKDNRANANSSIVLDAQQGCYKPSDNSNDSDTKSSEGSKGKKDKNDKDSFSEIPNKENVKDIYHELHDKHGFSAEFIAGMLANWWTEAKIDPTANEPSRYGEKSAKEATSGRMGIGYGQWTFERHTALVNWSKEKHDTEDWWKTDIQLDYMVKGDGMYVDILKNLALESGDDPVQEAVNFHNDWERSADSDSKIKNERGGQAKKVLDYMKSEGMDGKKDKDKINKLGKETKGDSKKASSSDTDKEKTVYSSCGSSSKKDSSSGKKGKLGESTKVNGKPGKTIGRNYKYEDLPKKYQDKIKLPKFKEEYYKGSPFVQTGDKGQCTEFTWAYMNQLWKGKQPSDDGKTTNGNRVHEVYKDKGAKVTKKPTVGYGFSSDPPQAGAADPTVGHTGVVAAVMDDGKWIMASTNLTPDPAPSRTLYYTVIDGTDGDIKFFGGVGNKPKK